MSIDARRRQIGDLAAEQAKARIDVAREDFGEVVDDAGILPLDILKGALLGSGMYDLKPVRMSRRSAYVKFTDAMEQELSAQRHLDRLHTPLILTHGTLETPEFQRQTRDFYAVVKAAGKPIELRVGQGYNQYKTQQTLANPYGFMGRAAFEQMKLNTA